MSNVNKVILIGNLAKDPDVKKLEFGRIANLVIATSSKWKDKNTGESKERTEWHKVSIMSDTLAGIADKYLNKGSKVYIEGMLETRKWNNSDGIDQYTTEVVLRQYSGELVILSSKNEAFSQKKTSDTFDGLAEDLNDDIPF